MKLKGYFEAKDTVIQTRNQPTEWEKTFLFFFNLKKKLFILVHISGVSKLRI